MKSGRLWAIAAVFVVVAMLATAVGMATGGFSLLEPPGDEGEPDLIDPETMPTAVPSPTPNAVRITGPQPAANPPNQTPQELATAIQNAFAALDQFIATATVTALTDQGPLWTSMKVWFQKPDKLRVELLSPLDDVLPQGIVYVTDGDAVVMISPGNRQAVHIDDFAQVAVMLKVPKNHIFPVMQVLYLRWMMQGLQIHTTITSPGAEQLLGRETRVLEVRPTTAGAPYSVVRIWADGETNLPLQVTMDDPTGENLVTFQFQAIDTRASIPASTFSFETPPGAPVTRLVAQDVADQLNVVPTSLAQAKLQAGFPVYTLPKPTPGTADQSVRTMTFEGTTLVAFFYGTRDGTSTTVTQSAAPQIMLNLPCAELAEVNGQMAQVGTLGSATVVSWVQGKTVITVVSSMNKDDTLRLAASLRPA